MAQRRGIFPTISCPMKKCEHATKPTSNKKVNITYKYQSTNPFISKQPTQDVKYSQQALGP